MKKVHSSIPESKWKWFGHAGHFICAQWCRYHLVTQVGKYMISSIGEYVPDEGSREIHCQAHGITLEGRGDARLADYMKKVGFQPLGGGPHPYETRVFKTIGGVCEAKACGCGMPMVDFSEIDGQRSMTPSESKELHMRLCKKYARNQ